MVAGDQQYPALSIIITILVVAIAPNTFHIQGICYYITLSEVHCCGPRCPTQMRKVKGLVNTLTPCVCLVGWLTLSYEA